MQLVEIAVPALLCLSPVYVGYRLEQKEFPLKESLKVWSVALLLALVAAIATVAVVVSTQPVDAPSGDVAWLLLSRMTAGVAVGAPIAFFYLQLKRRNRELKVQYREVSLLNKRISIVQRIFRHNLRNEMGIIQGHTNMLTEDSPPAETRHVLETIQTHQDRVTALVERANTIRSVWETDTRSPLDLSEYLHAATGDIRETAPTATVTTAVPDEAWVLAHPRLPIAIEEILTNAVQHNETTDLTVSIELTTPDDAGEKTQLTVTDTGSGIPDEELVMIDSPVETPLEHGSGLGLWLVYSVVTRSDGEFAVRPNHPTGSTVCMTLPSLENPDA